MGGDAQREVERGGGLSVRGIGGEHDPLGRHAGEQLDDVQGEEAGDVIQYSWVLGQTRGEDPLVADRAMRQDQDNVRVAQSEVDEPVRQRREAASGVDQDRNVRVLGQREDAVHLLAVERELLGTRM